ncbi:EamA family transporter [Xanthobacter sp. TB0136]|uniref:EamA family transporter n=1 Tax=Xanthobacter sp. TB0136 TaxID=3459177 RepID=UPI0040399E34
MSRSSDILLTALAPVIWGSTFYVTTEFLPRDYPLTTATLRALPAGLLLLAFTRKLPWGVWWVRSFILGALNFSMFWGLMFYAAYRLPGGVAATLANFQPPIVIILSYFLLSTPIRLWSILAVLAGICGVALLVATPSTALNPSGVAAGLISAGSMAAGLVLSRRWMPPVSLTTFAAWQLTAGGLLLVPFALLLEPPPATITLHNVMGIGWLSVFGAALTYILWFRGISRLETAVVSSLGFLSPLTAVLLGWGLLGEALSAGQIAGALLVISSIWLNQRVQAEPVPDITA